MMMFLRQGLRKTISIFCINSLVVCVSCESLSKTPQYKIEKYNLPSHQTPFYQIASRKRKAIIKQAIPLQYFSVSDFGALGNGIADDTKSIQKAIDAASASGGGFVLFPAGTYKIKIRADIPQALIVYPNIALQGNSYETSIIKLAGRQRNYNAIIGAQTADDDLSDFSIKNLTIDSNSTNNPVSSEANFSGAMDRFSVRVFSGVNVQITNSRFRDINAVNTLTVNSDTRVSDVLIENNIFEQIGGASFDYDHSTIYLHGKRGIIANNVFLSRKGAGTNGARTAIETHGDDHTVQSNSIDGFANGIYATGYASSSRNQLVTGNTIKNAHSGIVIWSYFFQKSLPNPALVNCRISNNNIKINVSGWRRLWGSSPNQGIALEPNSPSSVQDIYIENNEIIFFNNDAGQPTDTLANGISLWRNAAPDVLSTGIYLQGNKIKNALSTGIYVGMPISVLNIIGNTIVNPGRGKYTFSDGYRAGLIVGKSQNLVVRKNQFLDNQPINTIKAGMRWGVSCVENCDRRWNTIQVQSGESVPLIVDEVR
ncbi:MAG TPA: glycosyl hydrolase family 28-related protein [Stenomitos sp.]